LREAIDRLNYKYNPETTASQVSISEVDANLIASRGDRGLFAYLVEATMKEMQMGALSAMALVKNRVRQINAQSKLVEIETLSRLESLVRSTGPLPGRKVVFFISDGFVMDSKRSSGRDVLQSVANEAARVGAVVYTLDTRSNFFGAGVDASRNEYPDFGSRTAGRTLAESKIVSRTAHSCDFRPTFTTLRKNQSSPTFRSTLPSFAIASRLCLLLRAGFPRLQKICGGSHTHRKLPSINWHPAFTHSRYR
jgi:hypothetical protein